MAALTACPPTIELKNLYATYVFNTTFTHGPPVNPPTSTLYGSMSQTITSYIQDKCDAACVNITIPICPTLGPTPTASSYYRCGLRVPTRAFPFNLGPAQYLCDCADGPSAPTNLIPECIFTPGP